MPSDFRVGNAGALRVLGRDLQRAGRKDLKVELKKEVQRFTRDNGIKKAVAQSAREMLPGDGGHVRVPPPRGRRKDGKPRKARPRSDRKSRKSVPLNELVARARIKTVANFSGKFVGVAIIGSQSKQGKKRDLEGINAGTIRHPTFGRKPWTAQRVQAGYFDKPLEGEVSNNFKRHVFRAVNEIRRQLGAGGAAGGRAA